MPRSNHTQSPPDQSFSQRSAEHKQDDAVPKLSETAMRKKKNADAQAAFRARRANYIATLEETVTNLERVVVQLQDSWREARNEADQLKHDKMHLLQMIDSMRKDLRDRDREKYMRSALSRNGDHDPQLQDFPPSPASFASVPPSSLPTTYSASQNAQPSSSSPFPALGAGELAQTLQFRPRDEQGPQASLSSGSYPPAPGSSSSYAERSPSIPFVNPQGDMLPADGRPYDPSRMAKMAPYGEYGLQQGASREQGWHGAGTQTTSSAGDSGQHDGGASSHSPSYVESPSITSSEVPYFPAMEDTKTRLPALESGPYMFPSENRSISPTCSSPNTGSSTSMTSALQFAFPPEEHDDKNFRRPIAPNPGLTLLGGTADVSALSTRRATLPDRPMLGGFGGPMDHGRTDNDNGEASRGYLRSKPSSTGSYSSRSPSPNAHPQLSSTLAVIKAQAFGALRRSRRPRKAAGTATKAAMDLLEQRGISIGISPGSMSNKRQRIDDESDLR